MVQRSVLLLSALCALLVAVSPAHARDLQVGIAADALLLNGDQEEIAEAVGDWKRLGVDTARLQVIWSRVTARPRDYDPPPDFDATNPDDPGYAWHEVDRALNLLVAAGIKPTLLLNGPPPLWASNRPRVGNPRYQTSAWHFGRFAAAVAKRYGSVADDYILWNEPNLPLWLQPQAHCVGRACTPVSPHTYRYMVRAAYPEIHAADAEARVLIGALAPAGAHLKSRNANMRPLQFLRAFGCVDARLQPVATGPCASFEPATADGFAYHPHSSKHPPHEGYPNRDDAALAHLGRVGALVDALQGGGRLVGTTAPLGLWLDEYAYQTNPPDRLRGVTPGRQDRYLQQAAYLAWRNSRVQLFAQYLWQDEPAGGGRRYTGWQSGLLDSDGDPKPALAHFDDPLWVDFERNLVWGQIRPGTEHDVELQIRAPGPATAWQTVANVHTATDGTWTVATDVLENHAYRALYDGDRMTATHVAAPLSESRQAAEGAERAGGVAVVRRTVGSAAGAPIPPSFAGLSIEWRSVPDYIGAEGRLNPVFQRLVGELARAGNGAPTLRFGGDSTDHTWWNPDGLPKPPGIVTDVNPAWIAHLSQWVQAARTPLLLGLNMGLNDPGQAAALAGAARAGLPPRTIRGFELGNEPDLYATPRTYLVGPNVLARAQKRPTGYGYDDYRREIADHVAAVRAVVPDVGLSAGGFASGSWDDLQDDILAREWAVRLWGVHSYPLQTCDASVRRRGGARYIPKLLAAGAYVPIMDRVRFLAAGAASHGSKLVVSEINSAICGGLRGVSDTLASALWGADVLFGLAAEGVRTVDFHTWTGSIYGPLEFVFARGRPVARVRPLFYAMLLFNRATPAGSRLLDVGPNPAGGKLKTWGTVDPRGTRRVVVINKDPVAARKVVLRVSGASRRASVQRLAGPSLKTQNNVTFGGRGWGGSTASGRLRGKPRVERLRARGGAFRVLVPAGSAALVRIPAG